MAEPSHQPALPHDSAGMRLAAAALSFAVPGGGQVLRGHWQRGLAWWGGCALLFATVGATGALGFAVALIARFAAGPLDAARGRRGAAGSEVGRAALIVAMFVAMVAATIGVRLWLLEGFRVPAASMLPTLEVGDYFYLDKRATDPAVGDVIVFRHPQSGHDFVKRVVAVAGDRVAFVDGALVRNGQPVPHDDAAPCRLQSHDGTRFETVDGHCAWERLGQRRHRIVVPTRGDRGDDPAAARDAFPYHLGVGDYVVPAGHVFVLGDNRPNSFDSRFWGPVPLDRVRGTVLFLWMSRGPSGVRWSRLGRTIE